MKPAKMIIEIGADEYTHKILSEDDEVIWEDKHIMEGAGSSRAKNDGDIFDCEKLEDFEELTGAVDDLSFGPFGVAGALYNIKNEW